MFPKIYFVNISYAPTLNVDNIHGKIVMVLINKVLILLIIVVALIIINLLTTYINTFICQVFKTCFM